MAYSVSHTERTWGDDIESLLSNQVDEITRHEGGITETAYNCFRWALVVGVFMFLMIYPLYHTSSNTAAIITDLSTQYQNLENNPTSLSILSKKLDITTSMVQAIGIKDRGVYLSLLIFLAPFLAAFLLKASRKNLHSFIVISNHDKLLRNKLLRSENNSLKIMIASYILAILAGILGNYGYSWLTTKPTKRQTTSYINIEPHKNKHPFILPASRDSVDIAHT